MLLILRAERCYILAKQRKASHVALSRPLGQCVHLCDRQQRLRRGRWSVGAVLRRGHRVSGGSGSERARAYQLLRRLQPHGRWLRQRATADGSGYRHHADSSLGLLDRAVGSDAQLGHALLHRHQHAGGHVVPPWHGLRQGQRLGLVAGLVQLDLSCHRPRHGHDHHPAPVLVHGRHALFLVGDPRHA